MSVTRRRFLHATALSAAAIGLPAMTRGAASANRPGIIDTNVHLFDWPFRRLKYARTPQLVAKLRQHGIEQAWAGSFEALLSKDLSSANARLAEECKREPGFLLPFGSVNPLWPDWPEDLRRCHEVHRMPGVRLHPSFHGYTLDDPEFVRLVHLATERRLIVQIAIELEDPRVHHPVVTLPNVSPLALEPLLRALPRARIQLLCYAANITAPRFPVFALPNLRFDFASLEGVGAVGKLLSPPAGSNRPPVPPERFLFGSHAPYAPVEAALLRLFESPLERAQLDALMRDNARRLLAG